MILASDGLFDNLDEMQILQLVDQQNRANQHNIDIVEVDSLANNLVNEAYEMSLKKDVDGPFATAAKEHNILWEGKKR